MPRLRRVPHSRRARALPRGLILQRGACHCGAERCRGSVNAPAPAEPLGSALGAPPSMLPRRCLKPPTPAELAAAALAAEESDAD